MTKAMILPQRCQALSWKLSENTYQPFLVAADAKHLSKDDLGQLIRDGENDIV